MEDKPLLEGKVIAVTGGANGIGRAISIALIRAGARVIVNDIGVSLDGGAASSKPAEETVKEAEALGGKAAVCLEDISTMGGGRRVVEAALDTFGRIDGVACLAGIARPAPLEEITEADWDKVIATHLKGHFAVIQPAVKAMNKDGGSIVAFTSTAGLDGSPAQAAYAAAKAGIIGLTRTVALSAGPAIRCNAISPSARTRLIEKVRPEYDPGPPEKIAGIVEFLMSDLSKHITGQVIYASGDRLALYPQPRPSKWLIGTETWTGRSIGGVWNSAIGSDPLVRYDRYLSPRKDVVK
ncbi:3-oxoacyl-(acyl-carrier-protein) reductase FabG [Hyphomicrobiales bacterium]|nr:3-oxoacyl-(acyl-carrier-protein) reductase FabG [Hyphomicrobiales bacterium]CAH1692149.1 3-oxoacyl-(acyl-carrier-protein) reductase FabG [Hyphomicrobiales bacterium]